jgi:hypothetical protein
MRTSTLLLSAAALLAVPSVTHAQRVPVVQAGAEGRFELQIDPKTRVPGFTPATVAAFRADVDRLIGLIRPLAAVNTPPAPICHRLMSWIEINPMHRVMAASVSVLAPISFDGGRCHNMTGSGIFLHINALSGLLEPQRAHVTDGDGSGHWWFVPLEYASRRVIDLGDRIAFTHGRAPLLRPVSAERYLKLRIAQFSSGDEDGTGDLAAWLNGGRAELEASNRAMLRDMAGQVPPAALQKLADGMKAGIETTERELRRRAGTSPQAGPRAALEARLAALTPAERAAPACEADTTGEIETRPGCPGGRTLVELNPAYFDPQRPSAVQLLVIATPKDRQHGESDAKMAARRAMWAALDRQALGALVH